jgi:glycerol dehydrogenase-like iron-containing ADH family enzyme
MIAHRATVPGETIHNEPMLVTPQLVMEAMRAADSAGMAYRQAMAKNNVAR